MFLKGSRYANARDFEPTADGVEVFGGVRPREIGRATGVIEHIVAEGDRLDALARNFYNNDRRWWRVVDANPDYVFGDDILLPTDGAGAEQDIYGTPILVARDRE